MSLKTEDSTTKQRDKVEQYVYNCSGPFDAAACESATGVCINTVRRYLAVFEEWGLIKKMRHGNQRVYIRRKVTPEVKHNIRMAKMREVADWLHSHALLYYFAGSAFALMAAGSVA